MEQFKIATGAQIMHVPYKGIHQAIVDAMGGPTHVICDNLGLIQPHVKSGRMRAPGVTTLKRRAAMPDVPTVAESGVPDYEFTSWSGYMVPARVPREVVQRLNVEINKAIAGPVATEKFASMGSIPVRGTSDQFSEHVRCEIAKWASVIKTAGIKPN